MSSDALTQLLPAAFGLVGTVVGALIAQRGTAGQRRAEYDAKAMAALMGFTQAAAARVHPHDDRTDRARWFAYLDAKDAAFIALLSARLPRDIATWIVKIPHRDSKSESWRKLNSERAEDISRILEVRGVARRRRIGELRKRM